MRIKTYICDDCRKSAEFSSYVKARKNGWAISKDYQKCYCPACAEEHRRGRAKWNNGSPLPEASGQLSGQLSIDDILY